MSQLSHHLTPVGTSLEIRDFRVTGLPRPAVGTDAVPLNYLEELLQGAGLAAPRVVEFNLNVQPDVDGDRAVVAHNLGTLTVQVVLWRLKDSIWEAVLSQLQAVDANTLIVRFARQAGSYPLRAVITAAPASAP
jgi:hypothetical protein